MITLARASGAVGELLGRGLGEGEKLLHVLRRQVRAHQEQRIDIHHMRDRCEVAQRVERQGFVKRWNLGVRGQRGESH